MATAELKPTRESRARLRSFQESVKGAQRVWLVLHDGPDPDAMASGFVLKSVLEEGMGIKAGIAYGGIIGRPDNRAMLELLGIPINHFGGIDIRESDRFVCVDTQPGFSNHSLPDDAHVVAVIDHHPEDVVIDVEHLDVRSDVGSAVTIAVDYFCAQGLDLTSQLATAITYAIISETEDLGRDVSYRDLCVYMWALQKTDHLLIGKLRHPRVGRPFFRTLAAGLKAARAGEDVVVCHLLGINAPDELPRLADILNPLSGNTWVFCTGEQSGGIILTLRSSDTEANAEQVMSYILNDRGGGGGHGMVAGGSIELSDIDDVSELREDLTERFLEAVGHDVDHPLEPLIHPPAEEMIPEERDSDGRA